VLELLPPPILLPDLPPSLPEVPPFGSPSKSKRTTAPIINLIGGGIAIAVITVLATILASKLTTDSNPIAAPPVRNHGNGSGAAACLDATAGASDKQAMASDLTIGAQAATNGDIVGASQAIHQAAADAQAVATDTAADPAVSEAMQRAATDLGSAGDSLDAGDVVGATTFMSAATDEINDGTSLMNQTTVPAC
jgi:hypothetical protein